LVGRGELLGAGRDRGDLRLGPPLILRQHLGALGDRLVPLRELRQRGESLVQLRQARRQGHDVASRLLDRLAELLEPFDRLLDALDDLLVAPALLLHLVQDGLHGLDGFAIFGAIPEQTLEQSGHRKLLRTRRPPGPVDRRHSRVEKGAPRRGERRETARQAVRRCKSRASRIVPSMPRNGGGLRARARVRAIARRPIAFRRAGGDRQGGFPRLPASVPLARSSCGAAPSASAQSPRENAMKLNAYLNFGGNCAEAFRFYEKHLGGKIGMMMTHQQAPQPSPLGPDWKDKVLHARITIGDTEVMGADIPSYQPMRSVYLSLGVANDGEAERIFKALSEGGEIFMPM